MAEAKEVETAKPDAGKAKEKKGKKDESTDTLWSRRDFFSLAGWASFMGALGLSSVYFLRLLFPRVLFEPSPVFKAGLPSDYTVGEVSTKWVNAQRVWIIRDEEGIYVIFAFCTHLGCTPRWLKTESKYKCPCHGSGFTKIGVNFEGPAPRALERLKISLGPDGQIEIDKSKKFLYEKDEWTKPEAKLLI
jgi:cytochrome b6-f complex iron-sulfur subunit